jgi:lycopene cyclase domain-containing protein
MKEYSLLSVVAVVLTIFVDRYSRVNLLKNKEFYLFLAVILVFKFMVNGYLTGTSTVIYNPRYFLGLRIFSIPLEDFLFGFAMVTQGIIFWELFKKKFNHG